MLHQTSNRPKWIAVFATGTALTLCLAAVVAVRFQTHDPSASAGSETILDHCLLAGAWLVPITSVCFAKRLFEGHRFRFALSWLIGFLIPWLFLVYETFFPHVQPEGSYCTDVEQCFQFAIFVAVATGVINGFDSLAEWLLSRLSGRRLCFAGWLPFMAPLSLLMLGPVLVMVLM